MTQGNFATVIPRAPSGSSPPLPTLATPWVLVNVTDNDFHLCVDPVAAPATSSLPFRLPRIATSRDVYLLDTDDLCVATGG